MLLGPRRWLVLAGLVLAGAAAGFALLVVVGGPWTQRPDTTPDLRSLSPQHGGETVPGEVLASAWFVQSIDFASESELRGFRISVGLLDGTVTREVTIGLANLNPSGQWSGALPWASGPYEGQILYGYFDGTTSAVRVVSAAEGDDQLLLEADEVVHHAVLEPRTGAFYYLALDPATRREAGIFRGTLQGGGIQQLVPPRASPEASQIASRLFLSPDGSRLVTYDCRDDECRLRAYVTGSGKPLFDVAAPASDALGITDSDILLSGAAAAGGAGCPAVPCPAIAFDLESGRQRPVAEVCTAATVVDLADGPVLVSEAEIAPACGQAPYRVVATELGSGRVVADLTLEGAARELVVNSRDQAIALPDGWFVLGPAGQFYSLGRMAQPEALTLTNLEDGRTLELRPVLLPDR